MVNGYGGDRIRSYFTNTFNDLYQTSLVKIIPVAVAILFVTFFINDSYLMP